MNRTLRIGDRRWVNPPMPLWHLIVVVAIVMVFVVPMAMMYGMFLLFSWLLPASVSTSATVLITAITFVVLFVRVRFQ